MKVYRYSGPERVSLLFEGKTIDYMVEIYFDRTMWNSCLYYGSVDVLWRKGCVQL